MNALKKVEEVGCISYRVYTEIYTLALHQTELLIGLVSVSTARSIISINKGNVTCVHCPHVIVHSYNKAVRDEYFLGLQVSFLLCTWRIDGISPHSFL
jgi:hypothetical protein